MCARRTVYGGVLAIGEVARPRAAADEHRERRGHDIGEQTGEFRRHRAGRHELVEPERPARGYPHRDRRSVPRDRLQDRMQSFAGGQPGVNVGVRIVKTCNLTYFRTVTRVTFS
jgi:hypothetical protein